MKAKVRISLSIFLAVFFIPNAYVISQTLPPISKLEPSRKTIIYKSLLDLHDNYLSEGLSKSRILAKRVGIKSVGEKVRVDIDFYAEKPSIEYLAEFGIEKDDSFYEYGSHIQMAVPIRNIRLLENLPNVASVKLPGKGHPDIISQGVKVIAASEYHNKGYCGKGVKIAVIDAGFSGYSSLLGYELPNTVTKRSFYGSVSGYGDITGEGEDHGTACAEIIYDIAPEATLYLINFETLAELNAAVDYAISQNVDIVSHSMGWFNASNYDGTGDVCSLVDKARQKDILWVNSAGNSANRHYEGYFSDPDDDGWHNFSEEEEVIEIEADTGDMIDVYLSWNAWPRTSKDYDLYLWKKNPSGEFEELEWSENRQNGYQEPTESIRYEATYTGTHYASVRKTADSGNAKIEIFLPTHEFTRYSVPESSIPDPACSENALAVGATWWYNDGLEGFSSRGPTNDDRIKPDLVAPDGVSTVTYSSFWGTSASCPHVAGAAALMLELNPTWNPAEIENSLFGNARDLGSLGNDNLYGWGRISLPEPTSEPNLRPYRPAKWDYELVPSSVKETNTVDQLVGDELTYFDLAVLNDGEADIDSTQLIEVYIYIDGNLVKEFSGKKGLRAGWYVYWTDLPIRVGSGTHVVRFEIDPLDRIDESNEDDNIWERPFTWIKRWREYTFQTTDHAARIKIDGIWHDSPETFKWEDDTDHGIKVSSLQNISADSRYEFTNWSGKSTGTDTTISINASSEAAGTYQANYEKQYILVLDTDPSGLWGPASSPSINPPPEPGNWYNEGQTVTIAAPDTVGDHAFNHWEADGKIAEGNPITVTMDTTHRVVAFYELLHRFARMTVETANTSVAPVDLHFGVHPDGTDGYDSGLDVPSPPPSPDTELNAYFSISGLFNRLSTDIRPSGRTPVIWTLVADSESDFTLTWAISALPPSYKRVTLMDTIDMRTDTTASFDSGKYTLEIVADTTGYVSVTISLKAGWNLVSLPVTPVDSTISSLFPEAIIAYGWDGSKYVKVTTLRTGKGYWIAMGEDRTYTITGTVLSSYTQEITAGWSLVGSCSDTVEFASLTTVPPGCLVAGGLWTYGPEKRSYVSCSALEPGKGYWLAATSDAKLAVGSRFSKVAAKVVNHNRLSDFIEKYGPPPQLPRLTGPEQQIEYSNKGQLPGYHLLQNIPNPFNTWTSIFFELPQSDHATLRIYDPLGRTINILADGEFKAGRWSLRWDGKDRSGNQVASGVYLYCLTTEYYTSTKRMLFLK